MRRLGWTLSEVYQYIEEEAPKHGAEDRVGLIQDKADFVYSFPMRLSRALIGRHSRQEWEQLKANYNFRCAYCGKQTKLTKDHIVPVAQVGTNEIKNIVPACMECNQRKYTRSIDRFKPGTMLRML